MSSGLQELDSLDYFTLELSRLSKSGRPMSPMLLVSNVLYCLRMTVLSLQGAFAPLELAIYCFSLMFQKYFSI